MGFYTRYYVIYHCATFRKGQMVTSHQIFPSFGFVNPDFQVSSLYWGFTVILWLIRMTVSGMNCSCSKSLLSVTWFYPHILTISLLFYFIYVTLHSSTSLLFIPHSFCLSYSILIIHPGAENKPLQGGILATLPPECLKGRHLHPMYVIPLGRGMLYHPSNLA